MKTHKLEITAISAEALVDGKKPVKKNTYVTFDIAGNNMNRTMRTSTVLDEVRGNYPMWKEKLETEFSLIMSESTEEKSSDSSFMYVRVYCQSSVGKDKHVGTARVAIKDFTGEYAPYGFLHCLSYRLFDAFGRRNGIVNFSARIVTTHGGFSGVTPFWLR